MFNTTNLLGYFMKIYRLFQLACIFASLTNLCSEEKQLIGNLTKLLLKNIEAAKDPKITCSHNGQKIENIQDLTAHSKVNHQKKVEFVIVSEILSGYASHSIQTMPDGQAPKNSEHSAHFIISNPNTELFNYCAHVLKELKKPHGISIADESNVTIYSLKHIHNLTDHVFRIEANKSYAAELYTLLAARYTKK